MNINEKNFKIDNFQWGEIIINNNKYKDAKCYPGGVRAWDWNETGTRHKPGIQIADIKELLDNKSEIIILSKGVDNVLCTKDETFDYLKENKIEYYHLQSEEAVKKYNELCDLGKKVGGVFHSTC